MSQSWLSPDVKSSTDVESGEQHDSNWASKDNEDFSGADYSAGASGKNSTQSEGKTGRGCMWWTHLFLGTVLSILFIVAASLQWTDKNLSLQWGIFYVIHAILAILGTLRLCMCKGMLTKPILFTGAAMLIWSIVLLCIAAVDLSKTPKNTPGEDTNNRTARQEIGFELGGAILGCLSCIYFIMMCMCCDKAPKKD